ncbi:MAG: ADP-ribosylation factor-like protein [Candidatus Helarchaeota archaeon]
MKISLVGLSGAGKTSIYATTFASKTIKDTQQFAPTVMYEVRSHPYLGLNVSFFDFGGQEQYRDDYLKKPEVFKQTDVLIPIIDLHDPEKFDDVSKYLQKVLKTMKSFEKQPRVVIFYHKYDSQGFPREQLEANLTQARKKIAPVFKEWNAEEKLTSIYEQEKLAMIFRDILVAYYKDLEKHVKNAENILKNIDAKVIISDISGNVIVHNVFGVSAGLQLQADLRDFISSCNTIRGNFFNTDSVTFIGSSKETEKEFEINIFKYILAVLIMRSQKISPKTRGQIDQLLTDMALFADLVVRTHEEE